MTVDEAYAHIAQALAAGRPAHGYLIVGGVRGLGAELCNRVLALLFGSGDLRAHPDIHRLYPEKKSRIISIESMHERLIAPMDVTSYEGGWKAGVVFGADRLRVESANAFLKTLEEPPAKTIFLLLTEQPEQLLPTIISRCQRIDLPDARGRMLDEPLRGEVIGILASDRLKGMTSRAAAAEKLAAVLAQLKSQAEDLVKDEMDAEAADDEAGEETGKEAYAALVSSRYREFRADFVATLLSWFRDLMVLRAVPRSCAADVADGDVPLVNETRRHVLESRAARLSHAAAFRNITAVEEFATMLERNLTELSALSFLMDRLVLGTEGA